MEIVIPSASNIGLFIGAALVLLLIPGPAVLYIVARSMAQGRMAGFVSDLGIHAATLVHALGMDPAKSFPTPLGRPISITENGSPIQALS